MTKKTNDLVAVNVNVSSQVPPDTPETPFVAYVVDGGTISDLRIVLVQDGIIEAGDGSVFMLPGGRIVGKSAEDHAKWHSLLEVSIEIISSRPDIHRVSRHRMTKFM